jgi:hypothetical protein
VLGLKGNQGSLHEAVEEYFTTAQAADLKNVPYRSTEEVDNEQGRLEIRRYGVTEDLCTLPRMELWKGLREPRPGGTGVLGGRNPEHRTSLLYQLHRRGRSALAAGRGVSRRRKSHPQGQRTRHHDGHPTPVRASVSEGAFRPQSQEEAPEGRLE